MHDHDEPSNGRIAEYPGKVDALGDDKEMIVFRSVEVEDTDPVMWPVQEHIEKHGLMLAERITVDTSQGYLGDRTDLRWYMCPGYRRDMMPAPGELLEMWNLVNRTRRGPLKDRSEYGYAARFNEEMEVVAVTLRDEYADLLYNGRDILSLAEAEQLRSEDPDLFWKIIDNDE